MGHLDANIHHPSRFLQDVEVLAESFPTEVKSFGEHDLGNVFDALHQVDEISLTAGANRRETYPAIAEDRGRHTMP
jgi:hypothetical protein